MRVIIAGAGIGGLTLALSLHAAGVEAEVYETVAELKPLGVGLNVLPHAVRELTELGLGEVLAARAIATEALIYTNQFGQEIWREPRGLAAGYRWPQYSIHRGVLQDLLLEAVLDRLGPERVHFDHEVVRVDSSATRAMAGLRSRRDGSSRGVAGGDLVVAADGIHSSVRARFNPAEGPPIWNRRVLWRGVTETSPYLGGATMVMAGHQDAKFVCYPIDPVARSQGRSRVNWIAELAFPDAPDWRREDWNRPGAAADFLPAFEAWNFGWLDVPDLIGQAELIQEYPMVDRDPLDRWTHGRVTLLGDAAHPMYPIGSNGASQAIIDARTLAYELASRSSIDAALDAYEDARRPATGQIVLANRRNGPEQVMQMAHERAPRGFARIEDVISRAELEAVTGAYKALAGFDPQSLNTRPSLTPA
jgi:2-polyprenyl-6-methoxyphenol hydroxylase-like FAD-dependent oxidoreductase